MINYNEKFIKVNFSLFDIKGENSGEKMRTNNLVLGILAHVDAGKTTLSEQILFRCGAIGKAGRVDHQDTFLDTHNLEKERAYYTMFSRENDYYIQ